MPALIPINKCHMRPNIQENVLYVIESPQPPPQLPLCKTSPSDDKLRNDLDNQTLLVKNIMKMLGTEQMKLEMMQKEFHTSNKKRKQITRHQSAKPSENPNWQPKHLRVCSPSSINRNKSLADAVNKQIISRNPEEKQKLYTTSSCSGTGSQSSPSREKEELERFRNFWAGSNIIYDDDEEIDNEINIEDLVVEEVNTWRRKYDNI